MLSKFEKHLTDMNVFNAETPKIVTALIDTIPNNVPYKMKQVLTIHEIVTYISQFRFNILHWNNSIIPINVITFLIAESGMGKDSIVKTIRKSFQPSYDLIRNKQLQILEQQAIQRAVDEGLENPTSYHVYNQFLKPLNPMFVAPSTTEGFIQHLNDIDSLGIGAGYLSTSELGAELISNAALVDNIKLIAELYDEGNKDVKVLKDRSNQSKEIKNLPVSALFMGSQDNILFDDTIKRKVRTEFTTKLSRRSNFCYIEEKQIDTSYDDVAGYLVAEKYIENTSKDKQTKVKEFLLKLTEKYLESNIVVHIPEEVRDLILIYKKYNELTAETIDSLNTMTKLSRQHMHWKAMKIAGALALIKGQEEIDIDSYKYAITFVESISTDIARFEQELNKEAYEVFVSYVNMYYNNKELFLSLHDLKKKKFINNQGNPIKKAEELATLASIYDKNGLYKATDEGIAFNRLQTSDSIGISYLLLQGSKDFRNKHCDKGYKYITGSFNNIAANILTKDITYSPFQFANGVRGNDNIISSCKWIALDIDNSDITDDSLHEILEDLKHIIVRTSDNNNPYKFRLLLEFDNIVDVPSSKWKRFLESIADELAINIDILPKAQIFHSYAGRQILTNFEGKLFTVKPHFEYAMNNNEVKQTAELTAKDLDNPFETFHYAYHAKKGEGSICLYRAAKQAKDLGASKQQVIDLVKNINEYWIIPMSEDRLYNTIIKQIENWSF